MDVKYPSITESRALKHGTLDCLRNIFYKHHTINFNSLNKCVKR